MSCNTTVVFEPKKRGTTGNLLKFTPSEDGLSYTKIIPENELDVDLDDQCKYLNEKRQVHVMTIMFFQSFI